MYKNNNNRQNIACEEKASLRKMTARYLGPRHHNQHRQLAVLRAILMEGPNMWILHRDTSFRMLSRWMNLKAKNPNDTGNIGRIIYVDLLRWGKLNSLIMFSLTNRS